MIKQWDVFKEASNSRRANSIRVSLSKRSLFAVNQLGYEALNKPEAVELRFDKVNKLIGMQKCSPELPHAFKLKQQRKSNSYYIRAGAFCAHYKIQVNQTVVFQDPEVDDEDILILNLNSVKEVAMRRSKKSKADELRDFREETDQTFVLGGNG